MARVEPAHAVADDVHLRVRLRGGQDALDLPLQVGGPLADAAGEPDLRVVNVREPVLRQVAADVPEVVSAVADSFGRETQAVHEVFAEKVEARDAVGEQDRVGGHKLLVRLNVRVGGGRGRATPDTPAARLYITRRAPRIDNFHGTWDGERLKRIQDGDTEPQPVE